MSAEYTDHQRSMAAALKSIVGTDAYRPEDVDRVVLSVLAMRRAVKAGAPSTIPALRAITLRSIFDANR